MHQKNQRFVNMRYRNVSDYENFRATLQQECNGNCFLVLSTVVVSAVIMVLISL